MTRPNIYILLGTVFLMLTWLFAGLYRDDEFYEPILFTKYRPTFKVNFYSPIGQSDLTIHDLTADKQMEEFAFQEFIIKQHVQNNSYAPLWCLPLILIQLTLTFFSFGILKSKRDLVFKELNLLIHFAICLVLTSIGLGLILSVDEIILTVIGVFLVLAINYCASILLIKHWDYKSRSE